MNKKVFVLSILISGLIGIVFGIETSNKILLVVVGILVGMFIENRKYVFGVGISYGFCVSLFSIIPGLAMLSWVILCIGAIWGVCLVFVGHEINTLFSGFYRK